MKFQFEILVQGRKNLLWLLEPYSIAQLNQIPTGFKNNLVWNLGHVIVSHQNLCYKLSGLPLNIPDEYVQQFAKGTAPADPIDEKKVAQLKSLAISTAEQFQDDYHQGIFKAYQSYQSIYGVELQTIEDAIIFNNTHEGLHLGYMMAMRKRIV